MVDVLTLYRQKMTAPNRGTTSKLTDVERATKELEACEGCTGKCPKAFDRYFQPVIDTAVRMTPCKFARFGSSVPRYAGKSFVDYEVTPDNERAVKMAKWFASDKPSLTLYLYGAPGTGKTFLATLIAQSFDDVIFGDVPSLLDEIKRTFDGGHESPQEIIGRYGSCELLILDDIGTGKVSDWSVGVLYQIINARYNAKKPLIVTSNYDLAGLEERLATSGDDVTAQRIVSRLGEKVVAETVAFLGYEDRRKRK